MTAGAVRHAYLDWVRGLAVLIMIEAHVLDSWTRTGRPVPSSLRLRHGARWNGGAAVPVSRGHRVGALGAFEIPKEPEISPPHGTRVQKRGWQVFGLAFLFRLQSYILSGGQNAAGLLKVDILNVMGPSIAMAALAGRVLRA